MEKSTISATGKDIYAAIDISILSPYQSDKKEVPTPAFFKSLKFEIRKASLATSKKSIHANQYLIINHAFANITQIYL